LAVEITQIEAVVFDLDASIAFLFSRAALEFEYQDQTPS
jgi:hypothetical protein